MEEQNKVFGQISGEIFATLSHPDGRIETYNFKNIIVEAASVLMARLAAGRSGGAYAQYEGIKYLAVGTGSWIDLQNPPPALSSQISLENEISRVLVVPLINPDSDPGEDNIVEFTGTFGPTDANAALVEMGLFGGDAATGIADSGYMFNAKNFAAINKPMGSTLSFTWRLTF